MIVFVSIFLRTLISLASSRSVPRAFSRQHGGSWYPFSREMHSWWHSSFSQHSCTADCHKGLVVSLIPARCCDDCSRASVGDTCLHVNITITIHVTFHTFDSVHSLKHTTQSNSTFVNCKVAKLTGTSVRVYREATICVYVKRGKPVRQHKQGRATLCRSTAIACS